MDTLQQALDAARIKQLPALYNGRGTWIYAIVKVAKSDGRREWAIARFDGETTKIAKEFGTSALVVRIESVHPYRYLQPDEIPVFKDRDSVVRYLATFGFPLSDILNATDFERGRMVLVAAIKYAIDKSKTAKKYFDNMRYYKNRRK